MDYAPPKTKLFRVLSLDGGGARDQLLHRLKLDLVGHPDIREARLGDRSCERFLGTDATCSVIATSWLRIERVAVSVSRLWLVSRFQWETAGFLKFLNRLLAPPRSARSPSSRGRP
jgi:hypothetical protein